MKWTYCPKNFAIDGLPSPLALAGDFLGDFFVEAFVGVAVALALLERPLLAGDAASSVSPPPAPPAAFLVSSSVPSRFRFVNTGFVVPGVLVADFFAPGVFVSGEFVAGAFVDFVPKKLVSEPRSSAAAWG